MDSNEERMYNQLQDDYLDIVQEVMELPEYKITGEGVSGTIVANRMMKHNALKKLSNERGISRIYEIVCTTSVVLNIILLVSLIFTLFE